MKKTDNNIINPQISSKSKRGFDIRKFYIKTFGCQMNLYDSQCIAGQMLAEGFEQIDNSKCAINRTITNTKNEQARSLRCAMKHTTMAEADIILFNTCSVREHAEQRFYTNLGATYNLKEKNPELIVGVCGCVAEQEGAKLLNRYPWVKLIAGPGNISEIGNAVKKIIENNSRIILTGNFDPPSFPVGKLDRGTGGGVTIARKNKDSALVAIIRGCDNFCSYCVVPYLRGREQSRPMDEIIEEVKQIARDGYKEVMLLGQNVCAYNDFANLLREINEIEGIERIRFMTSHPRDVGEEMIDAVANLDRVCKEFHLPVQSGSNKILKAMNRGYTKEYYLDLINSIRAKVPGIRITTDIIVGFPGETEEDFQDTLELVRKIKFDDAFMFKYSDRPGTKANKKDGKIPQEIKEKRLKILMEKIRSLRPPSFL